MIIIIDFTIVSCIVYTRKICFDILSILIIL